MATAKRVATKVTTTTSDAIFVSVMNTEHFEFYATGHTAGEAEQAIARKFNELAPEHKTVAWLRNWYGINTMELTCGQAVRR